MSDEEVGALDPPHAAGRIVKWGRTVDNYHQIKHRVPNPAISPLDTRNLDANVPSSVLHDSKTLD